MTRLSCEILNETNGDVVQFMCWLKIWTLQYGKSNVDVVMMVSLVLDGPTLDWCETSVPMHVKIDFTCL